MGPGKQKEGDASQTASVKGTWPRTQHTLSSVVALQCTFYVPYCATYFCGKVENNQLISLDLRERYLCVIHDAS